MKTLNRSPLILITALVAMAGSAYGQVPSTNDTSTADGLFNTGMGTGALGGPTAANLSGGMNTASGWYALASDSTGTQNSAFGYYALENNTAGYWNTASGWGALFANTSGNSNTAAGMGALTDNTAGVSNTALGFYALDHNTTGNNNIAAGYQAGFYLTGNNNIDIGNVGVAGESNTIRIGTKGTQNATVIAGIYGTSVSGANVVVSSTGRLGVRVSSERYKTAIGPMGSNTSKLERLRPVTFHLKTDPHGALQYGLIAEEVAKVYPELVIRNESGRIDGVRYDELAPMLLNEVQQQHAQMAEKFDAQAKANAAQALEIRDLKQQVTELNNLKQEMRAALRELKSKDQLVAQR
jgi:hypothetical protein